METKLSSANGNVKTMSIEEHAHKHEPLKTAVEDLLCELRIDPTCLRVMARGYSPDYSGAPIPSPDSKWVNPNPKVQLSKVVAEKLLNTLDLQK